MRRNPAIFIAQDLQLLIVMLLLLIISLCSCYGYVIKSFRHEQHHQHHHSLGRVNIKAYVPGYIDIYSSILSNTRSSGLFSSGSSSSRLQLASRLNFESAQKFNPKNTEVNIESPTLNSRRITASIIIDAPIENVWSILTDYNNLATHVPNLIQSNLVPDTNGRTILFQEGAQKIVGFNFRASLTMEMTEREENEFRACKQQQLDFRLTESAMFSAFDGSWNVKYQSRIREFDKNLKKFVYRYKSKLTYSVLVKPRGPVPVFALEWRIREDIPVNLWAVKVAAERLPQQLVEAPAETSTSDAADGSNNSNSGGSNSNSNRSSGGNVTTVGSRDQGWENDETLSSYMEISTLQQQKQRQQEAKRQRQSSVRSSSSSLLSKSVMRSQQIVSRLLSLFRRQQQQEGLYSSNS